MSSTPRRVVITGMGVISPLANTLDAFWAAIEAGQSGVTTRTMAGQDSFPIPYAAEASDFQGKIGDFGDLPKDKKRAIRKGLKVMCRECQMGVAVAELALGDSRVGAENYDPHRVGISYGSDYMITRADEFTSGILRCIDESGRFNFDRWPTDGLPHMSPLWLLKYLPNMPASHLAIYNDFRGPNNSLTLREASGNAVLAEAHQMVAEDRADMMLVGVTGSRLHTLKTLHCVQHEELALCDGEPGDALRPFDRERSGSILGEGAGAVVVEELEQAKARGATIHAELLGGVTCAAIGPKMVADRRLAMRNALVGALKVAGKTEEEIGHVNAHGLSTRSCDRDEAQAINDVFGSRATPIPVSAVKSYFGNLGAGSGMVELIAGILGVKSGSMVPTKNYRTPDPQCPIAPVTSLGREPGDSFVKLSVTPQGQASAAVVQVYAG